MNKDAKNERKLWIHLFGNEIISSATRTDFLKTSLSRLTNDIILAKCKNIQNNFNYALSAWTNTKTIQEKIYNFYQLHKTPQSRVLHISWRTKKKISHLQHLKILSKIIRIMWCIKSTISQKKIKKIITFFNKMAAYLIVLYVHLNNNIK